MPVGVPVVVGKFLKLVFSEIRAIYDRIRSRTILLVVFWCFSSIIPATTEDYSSVSAASDLQSLRMGVFFLFFVFPLEVVTMQFLARSL